MEKYFNTDKGKLVRASMLIIVSAFIQAFALQAFVRPAHLIPGGFTGFSILLNLLLKKINIDIPMYIIYVSLNFPVGLICMRAISKRFVFLTLLQIAMTSFFLRIFTFEPVFGTENVILNICIGGTIYGMQLILALKVGGSSGGTDFIALYISNKISKSIWMQVFVFNMCQITVLGLSNGWESAGYSLIFQFITTRLVNTFYNRYHRITMQIMTKKVDEISEMYISKYKHGMTKIKGEGAYSKENIYICYAVVSVYEVKDIANSILEVDKNAIINTFKTDSFYGKFYIPPM